MDDSGSMDEEEEWELLGDLTEQHPHRDTYLDCAACHGEGVLVKIAELANGGELWRCGECGDEELID
jgi:hypothetical protein